MFVVIFAKGQTYGEESLYDLKWEMRYPTFANQRNNNLAVPLTTTYNTRNHCRTVVPMKLYQPPLVIADWWFMPSQIFNNGLFT